MTPAQAHKIKEAYRPLIAADTCPWQEVVIAPRAKEQFAEFIVIGKAFGMAYAERMFFAKAKKFDVYFFDAQGQYISLGNFFLTQAKKEEE